MLISNLDISSTSSYVLQRKERRTKTYSESYSSTIFIKWKRTWLKRRVMEKKEPHHMPNGAFAALRCTLHFFVSRQSRPHYLWLVPCFTIKFRSPLRIIILDTEKLISQYYHLTFTW